MCIMSLYICIISIYICVISLNWRRGWYTWICYLITYVCMWLSARVRACMLYLHMCVCVCYELCIHYLDVCVCDGKCAWYITYLRVRMTCNTNHGVCLYAVCICAGVYPNMHVCVNAACMHAYVHACMLSVNTMDLNVYELIFRARARCLSLHRGPSA